MPELKRVTLHPLKSDGSIDESVNLYPKSMISGLVDDEGNPMPGKGLSTNDFTNDDKELLDDLGHAVEIYGYYYNNDEHQIEVPSSSASKYYIREISPKGASDEFNGVYTFDCNNFEVVGTGYEFIPLSATEVIILYQTGLLADINTARYAYDNIDLAEQKINRYCIAYPISQLITDLENNPEVASGDISWSSSNGGSINIKMTALDKIGIFCVSNFKVKATISDGLSFVSATSNFSIRGLTDQNPEVTNKKTAVAYLKTSYFDNYHLIFKRTEVVQEDFERYGLIINQEYYDKDDYVLITTPEPYNTCIQISYQSLTDLVYSKEQADTKFLSKNENKAILILPDTTASADIYNELAQLGYPAIAYANFTGGNDGTVPFTSHTFFINDRRNGSYGYIVISNGAHYWFKVNGDVVTLENMYQIDTPIYTFEEYTPDFSSTPTVNQLPTYDTVGTDTQSQILRDIIKRGYTYLQNQSGSNIYTGTLVYSGIYDAMKTEAWFFIKDGNTPSLIKVVVTPEDTEYLYSVIPIGGSSGGEKYKHTVVIEVQGQSDTTFWFTYYSSSSVRITKDNIKDLIYNDTDIIKWCFASYQDDVEGNYKNGMIMDCWATNNGYGFQIRPTGTGYSTDIECLNNDLVNDVVVTI